MSVDSTQHSPRAVDTAGMRDALRSLVFYASFATAARSPLAWRYVEALELEVERQPAMIGARA